MKLSQVFLGSFFQIYFLPILTNQYISSKCFYNPVDEHPKHLHQLLFSNDKRRYSRGILTVQDFLSSGNFSILPFLGPSLQFRPIFFKVMKINWFTYKPN